jgi:alpha-amylase/alpha-mannosidase (GH57 family)
MTRVAILWHMHQPFYEDLVTREHIMPWVRLHALKDYYGMVALLREFPSVRLTFNLVPSLLIQLEAFAADRARDQYLELGLKPADQLTEAESAFIVANFFHAQRQRMIDIYPRYAELLERRATSLPFTTDDLRDLQVWQKLAWIDPYYLAGDSRIRQLVAKGRDYAEEDKLVLRTVELELLNRVIPEYRDAARRGQIELATSPFYHPILPLLCDTDIYRRTHPASTLPRRRFRHPEDAKAQLVRAADCHERLFGRRPVGLWPSEGSVSDAMVPLAARAGFSWMATDEEILAKSIGMSFSRDPYGHVEQPGRLYRPYTVRAGGGSIACVFRDHVLSDRIGFVYAGWGADAAADDFVHRLMEAGRRFSAGGGGEALLPVILDGENAWEHFEGNGHPFLRALYSRLASHPELRTVTMAEACAHPSAAIDTIFPGSWIDANFSIWIGHRDDQLAWGQLGDAHEAIESARALKPPPPALEQAREELFIAEGSDWFWWYGDDHSSSHDAEFDDLFRRHLRNVYRLLNLPVPDELFLSNISTGHFPLEETAPLGWLQPTLDGEATSYFEWLSAGMLDVTEAAQGAMHQIDAGGRTLTRVQFGFDRAHLFLRLDAERPLVDLLAEGYAFSFTFLEPHQHRVDIQGPAAVTWTGKADRLIRAVAGTILEVAIPLAGLEAQPGELMAFFVSATSPQAAGVRDTERVPAHRAIHVVVPGPQFSGDNWRA